MSLGRGVDQIRCPSKGCRKLQDLAKSLWKFESRPSGMWRIMYCKDCKNMLKEEMLYESLR